MLSPDEFSVGSLADAKPLCFLIPRTKHEQPILVTQAGDQRMAVFLGTDHRFESFECSTAKNRSGLLIPDIRIEVDEASVFDPGSEYTPNGALVREADHLAIAAKGRHSHGFMHQQLLTLVPGLPTLDERRSAGFRAWRIVIGEGDDKRGLFTVSVQPIDAPER